MAVSIIGGGNRCLLYIQLNVLKTFFVKIVRYNNHSIVMWRINVSSHISETLLVKLLTHGGAVVVVNSST
jgi:hypothetical protein